jgi:maleylacetate reductase
MVLVQELPASRVVFGNGALTQVPDEIGRLGHHAVMLIAGPSARPHADRVASALGPRLAVRMDRVAQHVPEQLAEEALRLAREAGADGLVSIGGGSATGLAKAVARTAHLPILAVPTTYAGSEMTPVWGVTAGGRKATGRDPAVQPRTVVYDPLLTLSLPRPVTAASGMNAAAQCVAALCAPDAGPVTALLAEEGLRELAAALPSCTELPWDLPARAKALVGAWLAGLAVGGVETGVHHKVCHVVGGSFGLPHADVHAAVLPHAAALDATAAPEGLARVARVLGAGEATGDAAGGLWDLAVRTGAPTSLRELGLRRRDVDVAAGLVAATLPASRRVDAADVAALLRAAWDGDRPVSGQQRKAQ